ncbi:hypothetical protein [Bosea sp. AAP35]|uniref:hypothetical protein n=1 Tax=Bosea sp. AAP35 TaxID=1523417 RepID=UPI000AD290ED|nr:hypothetical protein [Bosea sp. AAP35]
MTFTALMAIGSGAAYLVTSRVPTFNDVVHPCVEAELQQPPLQRMQTCLCLAEEVATPFWTARDLVLPAVNATALRDAMLKTCRARAFERRGSDRGPMRMSPMPRLTN